MNIKYLNKPKIIRRNVQLTYEHGTKNSLFFEDNAVVKALFVVLSSMFPPGEIFFIETVRNVRDQINNEKLSEDIRNFIAQEAFHSREHKSLNEFLIQSGYIEVIEIEAKTKIRLDKFRKLPAIEQLATTVVMEHFTATLARLLLTDPLIKRRTTERSRSLWEWHALEELEHKSVAFDVLNAIGGNSVKNRRKGYNRVMNLIVPIAFEYWVSILRRKDIKFSISDLTEALYLSIGGINRIGIFSKIFLEMFSIKNKNFNPLNMMTEQLESEYREKLFGTSGTLNTHIKF